MQTTTTTTNLGRPELGVGIPNEYYNTRTVSTPDTRDEKLEAGVLFNTHDNATLLLVSRY